MPLPNDIERHLTGEFSSGCCGSILGNLGSACCLVFLTPCAIARQRRQILDITGEPYVCCGGTWPCCGFDQPREGRCCLHLEVFCVPHMALAANRFLVQTRFNKRNSWMDNCCKIANVCVSCEFCFLKMCCGCTNEQKNLVKSATCICAFTHCQNAGAIKEIKNGRIKYQGPPAGVVSELPQHFSNIGRGPAPAPIQMQPI
jgi:hypothetical protein